jgi:hypothetical protein
MGRMPLLLLTPLVLAAAPTCRALAQQPLQPLPRLGACPLGYSTSGDYCIPSSSGAARGAIQKVGSSCPLGFHSSGNYCISSPGNERQAIPKRGPSCPLGWFSSGDYCLQSR